MSLEVLINNSNLYSVVREAIRTELPDSYKE